MDDTLLCIECGDPVEDCVCEDGPEYDEEDAADERLDQEREEGR